MRRHLWDHHPKVRSGQALTRGERAADRMRNGMGSWGFVFAALAFLGGWMLSAGAGTDPMPFILLNLILSCLAAMQGAILLIASKRQDQISSELAKHDYETNVRAEDMIKEIHAAITAVPEPLVAYKMGGVPGLPGEHSYSNEGGFFNPCVCGSFHYQAGGYVDGS